MEKTDTITPSDTKENRTNDEFMRVHPNVIDTFRIVELELFTGIKKRIRNVVNNAINE
ncbi:MAG: hypothetical protein MK137_09655 [Rickettsiales bacterium]|nr:hypothetical protein [Rickettsiales bacterium]